MSRKIIVDPLYDGNKLLQITLPQLKLRIVDSYRYIRLPLSKFNKRFPEMQQNDLAKGVFPHKMNKPEYYHYNGSFPTRELFLDEFSSDAAVSHYEQFKESWDVNKPYSFQDEMHTYLASDVRVLREGCVRLCKELFELQQELNTDPILIERNLEDKLPEKSYFHPYTGIIHEVGVMLQSYL